MKVGNTIRIDSNFRLNQDSVFPPVGERRSGTKRENEKDAERNASERNPDIETLHSTVWRKKSKLANSEKHCQSVAILALSSKGPRSGKFPTGKAPLMADWRDKVL